MTNTQYIYIVNPEGHSPHSLWVYNNNNKLKLRGYGLTQLLGLKNLSSEKISLCVTNIKGKFDIDQKKVQCAITKRGFYYRKPTQPISDLDSLILPLTYRFLCGIFSKYSQENRWQLKINTMLGTKFSQLNLSTKPHYFLFEKTCLLNVYQY